MLKISDDITVAETLPKEFYNSEPLFEQGKDKIFAKSWQLIGDTSSIPESSSVFPLQLLPGMLNEPLLLTRDGDQNIHCLSNVCTHRAHIVCEEPGRSRELRCRYHGRCFSLEGKFLSMPEFSEAKNFPRECDNLPTLPIGELGPLLFSTLGGSDFNGYINPVVERLHWLPFDKLTLKEELSKEYFVDAHWALYCENYLEGFHIPFVHHSLNKVVNYGTYETELFENGILQLAQTKSGEHSFSALEGTPESEASIAAYYYFLFPNTMLNVYPWGVSVNIVLPLGMQRTKIEFHTYVWDESLLEQGAGSDLDRVEQEDEEVVENVQMGIRSRLYRGGRFSPTREQGVHHFQRLLATSFLEAISKTSS